MKRFILTSMAAALAVATASGCKDDPQPAASPPAPTGGGATASSKPAVDDHEHADGKKLSDGDEHAGGDEHPDAVELGMKTVGGLTLKATQNEPIKAGGDGAFDLVITGGKPKAVRFWVGAENGQGSLKAKADEETPDHWHAHVEVPDPLPPGSKFFAEVEPPTGETFTVSFDLK